MSVNYQERVLASLRQLKDTPTPSLHALPVFLGGKAAAWLVPVSQLDVVRPDSIQLLAQWREQAADAFPAQFRVTLEGTQRWLVKGVLDTPDRLLFWVQTGDGKRLGHVGLFRFDYERRECEIDNIVRGVTGTMPGLMEASIQSLLGWTFEFLQVETAFLRVFSHNARAIRLYEKLGFVETMRMPLTRVQDRDAVRWIEVEGGHRQAVERYYVTMRLPFAEWRARSSIRQAA